MPRQLRRYRALGYRAGPPLSEILRAPLVHPSVYLHVLCARKSCLYVILSPGPRLFESGRVITTFLCSVRCEPPRSTRNARICCAQQCD